MPEERLARRILIVDDDEALRDVLTTALSGEGREIDGASDGTVALAMLEQQPYDLVLSDLRMPCVDGPTLYESLRGTTDPILEKPFPLRVIRQMVTVLLAASS